MNNPGLSQQAWMKLHKFAAQMNAKYSKPVKEESKVKAS